MRLTSLSLAGGLLLGTALVGGCPVGDREEGDVEGKEGLVVFTAETPLAFSQRLVVGSVLDVTFRADDADKTDLTGATLTSSNDSVLTVAGETVTLVGPGTAELRVEVDGAVVDAIPLQAGIAGATTLVDGALLAAASAVDARLPARFAFQTDSEHTLMVAAVDRCGGELLDLHASTLVSTLEATEPGAVPVSIVPSGPATFVVKTQVPGAVELTLQTPQLEDLSHDVQSVDPSQIDEVQAAAVAVDGSNVTLWGRAFVDDVELTADVAFTWTSDPRVTLGAVTGPVVTATVSFPVEGELSDDRPAVVTAEVFGESGSLELLSAQLTTARGEPARVLPELPAPATPSCEGGGACDPEAAALLALLGLARLRRRLAVLVPQRAPRG